MSEDDKEEVSGTIESKRREILGKSGTREFGALICLFDLCLSPCCLHVCPVLTFEIQTNPIL